MTIIESAGTATSVLAPTTEVAVAATKSTGFAAAGTGIDSVIARAKRADGTSAKTPSGKGGTQTVEQVVDAVVTIVVALMEVAVQVLSLAKDKGSSGTREPVNPKPIPLLPHKDPPSVAKPKAPQDVAPPKRLEAIQDDKGVVTVRTSDGYVVRAEGKSEAWTISAPDGKTTRIFGDPHVQESDGDRWDFKQRSTLAFGANKVTVETKPLKNGPVVSSRITVYSNGERVTIGGIDKNMPMILAFAGDGRQHDDSLSDGTIYSRASTKNGESWWVIQNGKKKVMESK